MVAFEVGAGCVRCRRTGCLFGRVEALAWKKELKKISRK